MKHRINPQVDCVFKAILGSNENTVALLDFLNAILAPKENIEQVEIINPYNEREFISDKLTIGGIKAQDAAGHQYQIEIQLAIPTHLPQRILYTWADIYAAQLQQGDDFKSLTPLISIWILANNLFNDSPSYHHQFQFLDRENRLTLSDHCAIHILELNKWHLGKTLKPEEHWLYFFKEAKNWDALPASLNTAAMRQAMTTLKKFSDKEREYHRYQSRQNALREQTSMQSSIEEVKRAVIEAEERANESEEKLKASEQKVRQLQEMLEKQGIAPDTEL
ncbi:MAG: Rpn family recombination-promoting nuclease/putative transposase [Pseudomonadales bacterium]|nr:Rpn family recombination-promoting nuclease/putative transposase [Pseudomonadales bacterium]